MNYLKRILCGALCLFTLLPLSSCSDNTWIMKRGDSTMPIGVYIYYLYQGASLAMPLVPEGQDVLSADIDGASGESYIKDRAFNYCQNMYWLDDEIKKRGLELSDEEQAVALQGTESQWVTLGESLNSKGVSKESFNIAYSLYNIKYQKVFNSIYGSGGEKEIPLKEIEAYFEENSYAYSFLFAPMTKTTEGELGEPLAEEDLSALKARFADYEKNVASGSMTLIEAGTDYAKSVDMQGNPVNTLVNRKDYQMYPAGFKEALAELKAGELKVLESEGQLVLLQKLPIEKYTASIKENEEQQKTILLAMKGEEFNQYLMSASAKEINDISVNTSAQNSIDLNSIMEDWMKQGTKK